jgi:peroxiredoxin
MGLTWFAERTTQLFPDDAEALETLVALIQYLKSVVSGILPSTSQNLFARRHNLTKRRLSAEQRKTIKAYEAELIGSIDPKSIEKKRDWEREFRAETMVAAAAPLG